MAGARLSSTLSDPAEGYPRIVNYIDAALQDPVLIRLPLLHAAVLIYKLDVSYASGSLKYRYNSSSIEWENATSRRPGEDLISLAARVITAFLSKNPDPTLTRVTVWSEAPGAAMRDARSCAKAIMASRRLDVVFSRLDAGAA